MRYVFLIVRGRLKAEGKKLGRRKSTRVLVAGECDGLCIRGELRPQGAPSFGLKDMKR